MAQGSQTEGLELAGSCPPMQVLLHGEPATTLPTARDALADRPLLLAELVSAEGPEQRRRIVGRMLRTIDFDWLAYGRLLCLGGKVQPLSLCTTHVDEGWARHYCSQAYFDVDPRVHDAMQSSLPCGWTIEGLQDRVRHAPLRAPVRSFVADLADTGMRAGALLLLPGTGGHERHFVSLLSRKSTHAWNDGALLGQVLTLGLCLHEFYTRYTGLPSVEGPDATLTPLQRKILAHLSRGASDKQIAYDLQLSSHAVDYHMRQLRRRFAVRNRVQLMQAAQAGSPRAGAVPALQ
ncbi:MAG: LuxR family transcriptional regulator [Pseudomonadota bacterium]